MLCVPFSALTIVVEWQEGHPAHRKPVLVIHRGFLPEEVEEEDLGEPAHPHSPGKTAVKLK